MTEGLRADSYSAKSAGARWANVYLPLCYSRGGPVAYGMGRMPTLELTDEELRLVRSALTAYLEDFGHEEADILRQLKAIIAKLPPAA